MSDKEVLENYFINDKTSRFTVVVGAKGSGKTFLLLAMIHYYLHLDAVGKPRYDEFHLVLPSFENEQNDSYRFLLPHKKKVFVYPRYTPVVLEMMMGRKTDDKRFFFCIDDSSGFGQDMYNDAGLTQLITCCRHSQVTIVIVAHSLKSIIKPVIRQNVDWLVAFTTQNMLVKFIWDEYIDGKFADSYPKWIDFQKAFYEHVWSQKHNALCLRLNPPPAELTWEVGSWRFMHFFLERVMKVKGTVDWSKPGVTEKTSMRTSDSKPDQQPAPRQQQPSQAHRDPNEPSQHPPERNPATLSAPTAKVPATKSRRRTVRIIDPVTNS